MQTYTIHAPPVDNRNFSEQAADYVFLKEGYAYWAALFGPFWLLARKLWLEALIYFVALGLIQAILQYFGLNEYGATLLYFMVSIIFALFAYDVERWHYARKDYVMISLVNGKSRVDCEAKFFNKLFEGAAQ